MQGSNIIFEQTNDNMIYYIYDASDNVIGMKYNDNIYYYEKNIQNDITGIMDDSFNLLATYEYDSWGNILSIKDTNGNTITDSSNIALVNPFRYRSYYYDSEIGMYYLNSRYYNSEWGRFINADSQLNSQLGLTGMNLYAYGGNNPINTSDSDGHAFMLITAAIGAVVGGIVGGVRAAKKGKNILKGAVTGALIGGAIGLGVGAIAGAALAGSFTASTAGVISGGAAIVNNLSSSGIVDTVKNIGSNIVNAIQGRGELTTLYRSVSSAEAASIKSTGGFSLNPGSLEIKQFALKMEEAVNFGNSYNQSMIAKVSVSSKFISNYGMNSVDPFIFKNGIVSIPGQSLQEFNRAISGVIRIFD